MATAEQEQTEALTPADKLSPELRAEMLSGERSMFFNVALYEHSQRVAQMFAHSTMVPKHFQGNVGNCMIALNYAHRLGADPFMTLQSLYVVHGRPGLEAKLVIAQINASNKYSQPIKYKWLDDKGNETTPEEVIRDSARDGYGCRAYSVESKSGETVYGPKVTWGIAKKEGWLNKDGSKWKSIPEIMFNYRAASWFANVNCPEMKLGMPTADELEDMAIDLARAANGTYGVQTETEKNLEDLKGKIQGTRDGEPPESDTDEQPLIASFKDLKRNGFTQWMIEHKDEVHTYSSLVKHKLDTKCKSIFEKGLDEILAEMSEPEPPEDDREPETGALNGHGRQVPCPNADGDSVFQSYCDNSCSYREGCPSWEVGE